MADTRQDVDNVIITTLFVICLILLFGQLKDASIRSLQQQLSQPCEVKR